MGIASARDPETYKLVGAAIEVHRQLGFGFLEAVYQEALEIELEERGIPFLLQPALEVRYRGRALKTTFRADFVCFHRVIVEIKALTYWTTQHDAQALNYLAATGFERAMLFNFGQTRLQHRRLVRNYTDDA